MFSVSLHLTLHFDTCWLCLRFSLAFESKVPEVDAAQTRLNTLTQRLTFAKRRVETIQGVIIVELNMLIAVLQFELHMSCKVSASQCLCFTGLIMRKVALQKVQQASKQAEQVADRYEGSHSHITMNAPKQLLLNMGRRKPSFWGLSFLHETAYNKVCGLS